jgi:hypothetical protein
LRAQGFDFRPPLLDTGGVFLLFWVRKEADT